MKDELSRMAAARDQAVSERDAVQEQNAQLQRMMEEWRAETGEEAQSLRRVMGGWRGAKTSHHTRSRSKSISLPSHSPPCPLPPSPPINIPPPITTQHRPFFTATPRTSVTLSTPSTAGRQREEVSAALDDLERQRNALRDCNAALERRCDALLREAEERKALLASSGASEAQVAALQAKIAQLEEAIAEGEATRDERELPVGVSYHGSVTSCDHVRSFHLVSWGLVISSLFAI